MRDQSGQAIVLIAIVLSGLLAGAGLAIDAGQLFVSRRSVQAAADAAAWAGAVRLRETNSGANAIAAATADAALNGYTNGVNNATVTVSSPPTSGSKSGDGDYVQVVITAQVRTQLLPSALTTVTGRAVAGIAPIDQSYAVIALDTGATSGALSVGSQGSLTISGGGVMINSSSSSAGDNKGSVSITPSTFGTDVVGNTTGTWPNKVAGKPSLPDPYANYPMPDTSTMTTYGVPVCCTLNPGVYTGDIGGNVAWTLNPGVYVLKGAAIDLSGNSSLTGEGVTIFITQSLYPLPGGTCKTNAGDTVSLTGNQTTTLSAPTSGPYQGLLIYQDPACTGDISVGGNGAIYATGTIYAPSATVTGNGTGSQINVTQIVAKRVDMQNANFTMTYSSSNVARPRIPALVE